MAKTKTQAAEGISLTVTDVSQQKVLRVPQTAPDSSVGELVRSLLTQMRLPAYDSKGPLVYQARRERGGRALHDAERVGDVLAAGDTVKLQPNIDAG